MQDPRLTRIADNAKLGKNVSIGEFAELRKGVIIGDNVSIGHGSVILEDTKIGNNVTVGHNSILGQQPLRSTAFTRKVSTQNPLIIEDGCVIGSLVVISAGNLIRKNAMIADHASMREGNVVGEETILGKSAQIEYDTTVGSHCKIINNAVLTGNMRVGNHVFISAMVTTINDKYMDARKGVEMNGPTNKDYVIVGTNSILMSSVEIGEYSIIGAGALVTKNVPPHSLAIGFPAKVVRTVGEGYAFNEADA